MILKGRVMSDAETPRILFESLIDLLSSCRPPSTKDNSEQRNQSFPSDFLMLPEPEMPAPVLLCSSPTLAVMDEESGWFLR